MIITELEDGTVIDIRPVDENGNVIENYVEDDEDPFKGFIGYVSAEVWEETDENGNLIVCMLNYDDYGHERLDKAPPNPFYKNDKN